MFCHGFVWALGATCGEVQAMLTHLMYLMGYEFKKNMPLSLLVEPCGHGSE